MFRHARRSDFRTGSPVTRTLERTISRMRWSIAAERVARAFWPLWAFALACGALLFSGSLVLLPVSAVLPTLAALGLAGLGLAALGARAFRWPNRDDAIRRLDVLLPGNPLEALTDTQATGLDDPAAVALWTRHVERMAEAARAARATSPDLRVSDRDRWSLRHLAMIAFIAALLFSGSQPAGTLNDALNAGSGVDVATGPAFEGWATPPGYTGVPVIYLGEVEGDAGLSLPAGSQVMLRTYGMGETARLVETLSGSDSGLSNITGVVGTAEFTARDSGEIRLEQDGEVIASWQFEVTPDAAPTIEPTSTVGRAVTGAMELEFTASDDYGVAAAWAEIELDLAAVDRRYGLAVEPVPRELIAVDLPMPLSGGSDTIEETLLEDFSRHPWVGLPVTITLFASDEAGQVGENRFSAAQLPGRVFYDPMAAALVEMRRDLLWSPGNARRVTQVIQAVTHRPEDIFTSDRAYLITRVALRRLQYASEDGLSRDEAEDVAELLWQAALLIEDGSLSGAAERLRRAQERLSQALKDGATDEEIAQLMDELRQATREFLDEMARRALENGDMQQSQLPPGQQVSPDQLQQLLDRIQELSDQGRREEARQLLEQLRQMMENMQMALQQGQQGQGDQQGQQLLEDLQDTLRQQQGLADESFRELQRQFQEGRQGQQGQQDQPGQQGQPGVDSEPGRDGVPRSLSPGELAQRQEALRQLLDQLRGQLPSGQGGGDAGSQALENAERNMGQARDGLESGDINSALDEQAAAIDALREGLDQLAQELRRAQRQIGDGERGQGLNRQAGDPLGRPSGSTGGIRTDESLLPDGDAMRRAREILDEIRRRSGERARPDLELEYLRRLLDRF